MKIRTGLVSNSSSSSFCIVGTAFYAQEIAEAAGYDIDKDHMSYGRWDKHNNKRSRYSALEFVGYDEIEYVGIDAESRIREDKTLTEMKQEFIQLVDSLFGIKVPPKRIDFFYGEAGNG